MARVRVNPIGVELELADGESIIEAAWRLGYYWPTICQGQGQCTQCHIVIESGVENFLPPDGAETEVLEEIAIFAHGDVRLACQSRLTGDAVVTKQGVKFVGATQQKHE